MPTRLWTAFGCFIPRGERETDGGHDFRPRTTPRFFWADDRTNFPTVDQKNWETCFLQGREAKSRLLYLLLPTKTLSVLGVSINHVDLVTLKCFWCKQVDSLLQNSTNPLKEVLRIWGYIKTICPSFEESLNIDEWRLITARKEVYIKRKRNGY